MTSVSSSVKPVYPVFKPILLNNQGMISDFLAANQQAPTVDSSLWNLLFWTATGSSNSFSFLNGNLVVRQTVATHQTTTFIGQLAFEQTLDTLLATHDAVDLLTDGVIHLVNPKCYEISELRDRFEYLCSAESLSKMTGRAWERRRTDVNTFRRACPTAGVATLRLESRENRRSLMDIFEQWMAEHPEPDESGQQEVAAFERFLSFASCFDYVVFALKQDQALLGFQVYELFQQQQVSICWFAKTLHQYPGASTFLYNQSAGLLRQHYGISHINMTDDLGLQGLRTFKLSLRPERLIKKYSVRKRFL
jgi:hypothetical protein